MPIGENHDTAIILYPSVSEPWESFHFYSVPPESFTQDEYYKGHINKLEITDTTFINRLTKNVNDWIVQKESGSIDTWFMVLLTSKSEPLPDTLAVSQNVIWFNRKVYIDSTIAGIIADEIIRHDKDFAIGVNNYYDNGKWYPYLGKKLTNEFLNSTHD